ncbi:MAG: hypothetical protein QM639_15685, partial [Rhodocyclaceae bacterium]
PRRALNLPEISTSRRYGFAGGGQLANKSLQSMACVDFYNQETIQKSERSGAAAGVVMRWTFSIKAQSNRCLRLFDECRSHLY